MFLEWEKKLSKSDAIRYEQGGAMNFLRLTKASLIKEDYTSWFREEFFGRLDWQYEDVDREFAQVSMHVFIKGDDYGMCAMKVDHKPSRSLNHNAPPTHLNYGTRIRSILQQRNVTGLLLRMSRNDDLYRFEIL